MNSSRNLISKGVKFFILIALFISISSLKNTIVQEDLRINQIQILTSHNSYRMKTDQILNYFQSIKHPLLKHFFSKPLDYSHTSFEEQFSVYGMRGLEIDIYHDPEGGLFYNRKGNKLIHQNCESGIESLQKPGLKVMHIPDFDYTSNHYTFIDALQTIKKWSEDNPSHLALYIMVEAKEHHSMMLLKKKYCTKILKFTKNALDSIDLEIKQVFGENSEKIITPDKIRKEYKTLNQSILSNQWPTVSEARGRIIFILSASETAKNLYLENHYSLKDRVMFVYSSPGNPETAFVKKDDPKENFLLIQELVQQGYMVRTRADANTTEARKGDYSRFNKAINSGAQIIATDYYKADIRNVTSKKWSNYFVQFPDKNIAKINSINGSNGIQYIKQ